MSRLTIAFFTVRCRAGTLVILDRTDRPSTTTLAFRGAQSSHGISDAASNRTSKSSHGNDASSIRTFPAQRRCIFALTTASREPVKYVLPGPDSAFLGSNPMALSSRATIDSKPMVDVATNCSDSIFYILQDEDISSRAVRLNSY